jgi:hypothetical protein
MLHDEVAMLSFLAAEAAHGTGEAKDAAAAPVPTLVFMTCIDTAKINAPERKLDNRIFPQPSGPILAALVERRGHMPTVQPRGGGPVVGRHR